MGSPPFLVVIPALLVAAAVSDVSRHRIPNAITVCLALAALGARAFEGGPSGALSGLAAGLAAGALLYPAWTRRAIGGGDLKLAVAAGLWVGLPGLGTYLLASAVAGGALAAGCYAASSREARREIRGNLLAIRLGILAPVTVSPRVNGGRVPVPAGAAIAAGALAASVLGG
ncbi:MAG TPA: A24 family peptidase [Anaeromyxobacter sp.]